MGRIAHVPLCEARGCQFCRGIHRWPSNVGRGLLGSAVAGRGSMACPVACRFTSSIGSNFSCTYLVFVLPSVSSSMHSHCCAGSREHRHRFVSRCTKLRHSSSDTWLARRWCGAPFATCFAYKAQHEATSVVDAHWKHLCAAFAALDDERRHVDATCGHLFVFHAAATAHADAAGAFAARVGAWTSSRERAAAGQGVRPSSRRGAGVDEAQPVSCRRLALHLRRRRSRCTRTKEQASIHTRRRGCCDAQEHVQPRIVAAMARPWQRQEHQRHRVENVGKCVSRRSVSKRRSDSRHLRRHAFAQRENHSMVQRKKERIGHEPTHAQAEDVRRRRTSRKGRRRGTRRGLGKLRPQK